MEPGNDVGRPDSTPCALPASAQHPSLRQPQVGLTKADRPASSGSHLACPGPRFQDPRRGPKSTPQAGRLRHPGSGCRHYPGRRAGPGNPRDAQPLDEALEGRSCPTEGWKGGGVRLGAFCSSHSSQNPGGLSRSFRVTMETSGPTSWPEPSQDFTTSRPAPGTLCTYAHPPTPVPCSPEPVGGREERQGQHPRISAQPQRTRSPSPAGPGQPGGRAAQALPPRHPGGVWAPGTAVWPPVVFSGRSWSDLSLYYSLRGS